MKNKKVLLFWKIAAAGIVSFAILNLLCMLYYNSPIHSTSGTMSTDYVWEKNKFYSRGTEGFALGVTDDNGFNNLEAFEKGEIDILLIGSSHVEAFNVAQDKNIAAVLNKKTAEAGLDLNTYNIGISGHYFEKCLKNLENAIKEFEPKKYVVIETLTIKPDKAEVVQALDGTMPIIASHSEGIVGKLQKLPYLRLVYSKLKNITTANEGDTGVKVKEENNKEDEDEYYRLLDELIGRNVAHCKKAGVKTVIYYNCELDFDEHGNIIEQENLEDVEKFRILCEKNDVIFLNMHTDFEEYYNKYYKLPRGFSNTEAGSGHINEDGHRIIAERIYREICK